MKPNLKELEKIISRIEETMVPKPKQEIRFTLNKDEIDESLEHVVWVYCEI